MHKGALFAAVPFGAAALASFCELAACGLDAGGAATPLVDASFDAVAADAPHDVAIDQSSDAEPSDADPSDAGPVDAPVDAPVDSAPPVDSGPADCGSLFTCNGACVSTCVGCEAGLVLCTATRACGSDCTSCVPFGFGVPCYSCAIGSAAGICAATSSNCPNDTAGGACACSGGDAGECPGATQICSGGGTPVCKTCGQGGTDKKQCGTGLFCTGNTGACDRDQ
jgi:hypothetical protein